VNLGVAENALMHREVVEFVGKNTAADPVYHITFGAGPKGSPRLRKALARFSTPISSHASLSGMRTSSCYPA
jgi:hypothetical protein